MRAYCYASGLIEFGRHIPNGALPIARGPAKSLRGFIDGNARHGYQTTDVNGRPTKVPGTDCLLVPGIPEAPDQSAAGTKLREWCDWLKRSAPAAVSVA